MQVFICTKLSTFHPQDIHNLYRTTMDSDGQDG